MKGYLSIGAVSRQKGISIKSLRYYDQIGVLKPAYINQKTNYRYYTQDQLYLLDAISLCIELGIPLKEFCHYQDSQGCFDLRKLLYDGKLLAEQKILDIRTRLSAVQTALETLGDTPPQPQPKESAAPLPPGFYQRTLPMRAVLTAPFEEADLTHYSQKILRLFMLAQLLGLSASYPSGILYEYDAQGNAEKYMFIQVEQYADCTDKRLRILPEGTYFCQQGTSRRIMNSPSFAHTFSISGHPYLVAECDLIDNEIKKDNNTLELQIIQIV